MVQLLASPVLSNLLLDFVLRIQLLFVLIMFSYGCVGRVFKYLTLLGKQAKTLIFHVFLRVSVETHRFSMIFVKMGLYLQLVCGGICFFYIYQPRYQKGTFEPDQTTLVTQIICRALAQGVLDNRYLFSVNIIVTVGLRNPHWRGKYSTQNVP